LTCRSKIRNGNSNSRRTLDLRTSLEPEPNKGGGGGKLPDVARRQRVHLSAMDWKETLKGKRKIPEIGGMIKGVPPKKIEKRVRVMCYCVYEVHKKGEKTRNSEGPGDSPMLKSPPFKARIGGGGRQVPHKKEQVVTGVRGRHQGEGRAKLERIVRGSSS